MKALAALFLLGGVSLLVGGFFFFQPSLFFIWSFFLLLWVGTGVFVALERLYLREKRKEEWLRWELELILGLEGEEYLQRKQNLLQLLAQSKEKMPSFQRGKLSGLDFSNMQLQGCDFRYAELSQAKFFGASLAFAKLQSANLEEAHLEGTNLEGANLQHANLERSRLNRCTFRNTDLRWSKLGDAALYGSQLEKSHLEKACFFPSENNRERVPTPHSSVEDWIREKLDKKGVYTTRGQAEKKEDPSTTALDSS